MQSSLRNLQENKCGSTRFASTTSNYFLIEGTPVDFVISTSGSTCNSVEWITTYGIVIGDTNPLAVPDNNCVESDMASSAGAVTIDSHTAGITVDGSKSSIGYYSIFVKTVCHPDYCNGNS